MGVWTPTDWATRIEDHRQALLGVLAGLVALAACLGGGPTLPRHLHRAVMRLLRPAESAARRLAILVALRLPMPEIIPPRVAKRILSPPLPFGARIVSVNFGLAVAPPPPKRPRASPTPAPAEPTPSHKEEGDSAAPATPSPLWGGIQGGGGNVSHKAPVLPGMRPKARRADRGSASRPPVFPLLDPMRRIVLHRRPVRTSVPQIWVPGYSERLRVVPRRHDDAIDAGSLSRRLAALAAALDDLPRQALRFLRWQARNAAERAAGLRRRIGALRGGPPPGQNRRRTHEVHDLLARLHSYADYALAYPDDTS